jgi:hypothetical protein
MAYCICDPGLHDYEKILLTSIIRRNQYMIESRCICLTKILSYLNNGSRKDIYLILSGYRSVWTIFCLDFVIGKFSVDSLEENYHIFLQSKKYHYFYTVRSIV